MLGPVTAASEMEFRVVDFSFGIAGAYCCKLLSDAGADVVKVEPPEGDPWRSWTAGGAPTAPDADPDEGAALFRFVHHGVRPTSSSRATTPTRRTSTRCACATRVS